MSDVLMFSELEKKSNDELKELLSEKEVSFKSNDNKQTLVSLLISNELNKTNNIKEDVEEGVEKMTKEDNKIEFRTVKGKNFVGFVHPDTRRLVSVNEQGRIFVDKTDVQAIAILNDAQDVFLVED